jgi:DNA-binding response OmpR family regulator
VNPSSRRILVVDDTPAMATTLRDCLVREGFSVTSATSGEEALSVLPQIRPDLVLLDLVLPGMEDLDLCRRIRSAAETAHISVIIISSKSDEMDKVAGLEAGANDYMTKPVGTRELVARINSLLRQPPSAPERKVVQGGRIELDLDRHTVSVRGVAVKLTSKEFDLLGELMQANGRVLRREYLLDRIWDYRRVSEIESRTVDVHVASLRRKLASEGHRILTVRNAGYRFDLLPDGLRLENAESDERSA